MTPLRLEQAIQFLGNRGRCEQNGQREAEVFRQRPCHVAVQGGGDGGTRARETPEGQAQALNDADDTPLEVDLQAWVNDLQNGALYQQTEADADKVGADCGAVGIKLFPVPSS